VIAINPGTQAERRHPQLRPGLVLAKVGDGPLFQGRNEQLHALKGSGRPVTLEFVTQPHNFMYTATDLQLPTRY
jgi:hypothetical protein